MPLSLYGSDNDSNKTPLEAKIHNDTHRILNIHHKIIRKMRAQLNDTLIRTPKKLKHRQSFQKLYFSPEKVNQLEDESIYAHTDSRVRQMNHKYYTIKSILWETNKDAPNIDKSRLEPPVKNATHNEYVEEHMERLYMLFCMEHELSKAQIQWIKEYRG